MTEIRLRAPVVRENAVDFEWSASPDVDLYLRPRFTLTFPDSVDISKVPEGLWLRIMLICLFPHWALLRPCRVVLPQRLPAGEREFWARLVDATVWTLEIDQDADGAPSYAERTRRTVEIVDSGPPAGELTRTDGRGGVVASFSGGRDSLTQAAMLNELGQSPLLVTTVSRREGSIEFETERFRMVLDEMQQRTGLELVEVKSDIRTCFVNGHPLVARYRLAVSELTDTLLYFANCWAVASARGAEAVYLASEAEAQESIRREGMVVQIEHMSFTSATQQALSALTAPTGITYGGLTSALQHFQIQRVLDLQYPELSDLQYSCFKQSEGDNVCNACFSCLKTSLHKMTDDSPPSEVGIDLDLVLINHADWSPDYGGDGERRSAVGRLYGERMNNHVVRVLRALDADRVAAFTPSGKLSDEAAAALDRMRATAFAAPDPPDEPGYRAGYLELLDDPVRDGLNEIFAKYFEPEPPELYADMLQNTRLLSGWIAAPLGAGRLES